MNELFEPGSRGLGIPPICLYENLPSFATEAAAAAWNVSCGGAIVTEKWLCKVCGHWHYTAAPVPPSGASSGRGRVYRQPPPRYRREMALSTVVVDDSDDGHLQ